jgi:hypothetical protein
MRFPEIDDLRDLERSDLQALWLRLFKQPAPPKMHRQVMTALLAYRLQERQEGGLSNAALVQLHRAHDAVKEGGSYKPSRALPYKAGTRIIRRWGREVHEVTVLERGYDYRGQVYRSLSQIAREITGVRWNGPAFFGLRKGPSKKAA